MYIVAYSTEIVESGVKRVNRMPKTERMSGELLYTIDPKGRMSFPPKFREILGERFILTKGPNNKLVAYSEENWEKLVEQIAEMDLGREKDILTQMCAEAVRGACEGRVCSRSYRRGRDLGQSQLRRLQPVYHTFRLLCGNGGT